MRKQYEFFKFVGLIAYLLIHRLYRNEYKDLKEWYLFNVDVGIYIYIINKFSQTTWIL